MKKRLFILLSLTILLSGFVSLEAAEIKGKITLSPKGEPYVHGNMLLMPLGEELYTKAEIDPEGTTPGRRAGTAGPRIMEVQEMHAIAEVQIIPIGVGVSVRKEVKRAHELLEASGLPITLHANGSNLEGELSDVLGAIRKTIETLHDEGIVRLSTHIKVGTRTDKVPSMAGKLFK